MNRRRRNSLLTLFALASGAAGIALYAQNAGFTESWRQQIEKEFAKRGYQAEVGKLTLGPIQGLVAKDVKIYLERSRRTEIASIDQVILDVDLGQILEKELSLNSIDFEQAKVSLPLDPGDPTSQRLQIADFSARAVMSDQDIEIVHASAVIHGLPVSLKGHLYRPPLEEIDNKGDGPEKTKEERSLERKEQLARITERLQFLGAVLAQLEQFDFSGSQSSPGLELEISGDLAETDTLNARCEIALDRFRRGALEFEQLRALVEFNGERLSLRELLLRDIDGELRLNAEWPVASDTIHLKLESELDAQRILTTLSNQAAFGEVVFFAPPQLQFEGDWTVARIEGSDAATAPPVAKPDPAPAPAPSWPLRGIGSFSCDGFTSRGAVFESFKSDFSIADDKAYFRNLRLDHKSGLAQANVLYDAEEGLQYQAELKFDPKALLPFVSEDRLRRYLSKWSFNEESTIYIGAEGARSDLTSGLWSHSGVVDLRRCRLNGVDLQRFEMDFESDGRTHTMTKLKLQHTASSSIEVDTLIADFDSDQIHLENFRSDVRFTSLTRLVTPLLVKQLAAVKFASPPRITAGGTVDLGDVHPPPDEPADDLRHDLLIDFEIDGDSECQIFGHRARLSEARGLVRLLGPDLLIESLHATAFGGSIDLDLALRGLLASPARHQGQGQARFHHGQLFSEPLLAPIVEILAPDLRDVTGLQAKPATAMFSFTLAGSQLAADPLQVTSDELSLTGTADVDLRALSVDGDVLATTPSVPSSEPEAVTATSHPFEVDGSLEKPNWKAK